jgi:hypothetical protein
MKPIEQVEREDLLMFINACLSCTGQGEFYDDHSQSQRVSLDFLHDYILGNYRLLYCRTLAAGINHFNQAQIVTKLLASGDRVTGSQRIEENQIITKTLRNLPPQRAWGLLLQLRKRGINNRRSRSIAKAYIASWGDKLPFQLVKYRSKIGPVVTHFHLRLEPELDNFLFGRWDKAFPTPLLEKFRQAHYSASAIYSLPFTIAEGLAAKHKVPRPVFLEKIQSQMTPGEKLRLQNSAAAAGTKIAIDPRQLSITKLALYILSLPIASRQQRHAELHSLLTASAAATLRKNPLQLGKVAAVFDRSYSSSGSAEKRRRPLGIALAVDYLLRAAAQDYRAFWTVPIEDSLLLTARGQTDLAIPILAALADRPETIVVISDGWENDPPGATAELLLAYYQKIDPQRQVSIVHYNPVFNANDYTLKEICPLVTTIGIREAEDLPTVLQYVRFADGQVSLAELEAYLAAKVHQVCGSMIDQQREPLHV